MSVGDSDTSPPPGRAPPTHTVTREGNFSTARSGRVAAESLDTRHRKPDGPMVSAIEALDFIDGVEKQHKQCQPEATVQTPRSSPRHGENMSDCDAARCELERLLKTAGSNERKMKIKEALDRVESGVPYRGTALAIIVNDTLAIASAAVASSKKRHQSYPSSEHGTMTGGSGTDGSHRLRSRFDRNDFKPWKPDGLTPMAIGWSPLGGASGIENADPPLAAGRGIEGALNSEPNKPQDKARRLTVQVLSSIPEHRVAGLRVQVKEIAGNSVKMGHEEGEKEGGGVNIESGSLDRHARTEEEKKAGYRPVQRGAWATATTGLEPSLALPWREEKVLDVPQDLFAEATSTGVDPSHPPSAAVDGVLASYWLSTGLFPQILTIRLQRPVAVYEVMVACGGVSSATVHLGHINGRTGRSEETGGIGVSDSSAWDASTSRGDRRKQCSSLELVRQQPRPSMANGGGGLGGGVISAPDGTGSDSGIGSGRGIRSGNGGLTKRVPSLSSVKLTFRVPEGTDAAEKVDQLSLVVTNAEAPFCLVTSVDVRGQFSRDDEEEVEDSSW